jgi:glycine cleavage system H protein
MPFTGHVNAINQALSESPGLINSDPYGEGWLIRLEPGDPADIDGLMDAEAYEAFVSANEE